MSKPAVQNYILPASVHIPNVICFSFTQSRLFNHFRESFRGNVMYLGSGSNAANRKHKVKILFAMLVSGQVEYPVYLTSNMSGMV